MTRQEQIQKITEEIMAMEYGETITHGEVAAIIGEQIGSKRYRDVCREMKRRLLDGGKMVENVFGVGYRVVCPDEYTTSSVKRVVSGAKMIDRGCAIMRHAPVREMSPEGVQAYNCVNDRIAILQAAVAGAKVELNMLNSKRPHPLLMMNERNAAAR